MSVGQMFLDKCLDTNVVTDPWPHQIITKTFDDKVFTHKFIILRMILRMRKKQ